MNNSVEQSELIERICSKFEVKERKQGDRRLWISIDKKILMDMLKWAKKAGFNHCSAISVTDWPDEEIYELTYHLWSYTDRVLLTVKTQINRKEPTIESAVPLWGGSAQIHERELHELFGVEFVNNPDLEPLFLEDWEGPPPFKKDFDWRDYVREEHYDRGNEREKVYWD